MQPASRVPVQPVARAQEGLQDAPLLARLAARDTAAFAVVYDRHAALAFGAASRLVADAEAAERVVEAAFLALWRQAPAIAASQVSLRARLLGLVCHHAHAVSRGEAEIGVVSPVPGADGVEREGSGGAEQGA